MELDSWVSTMQDSIEELANKLEEMRELPRKAKPWTGFPAATRALFEHLEDLPTVEDSMPRIAFWGTTARGKSMMLNRLAGAEVFKHQKAKADVAGVTQTPMLLRYGEEAQLMLYRSAKEICGVISSHVLKEDNTKEPIKKSVVNSRTEFSENLAKLFDQDLTEEDLDLDLEGADDSFEGIMEKVNECMKQAKNKESIMYFELKLPLENLHNMELIDIPGYGDLTEGSMRRLGQTQYMLHTTNIILQSEYGQRGDIKTDVIKKLEGHGWLHHRDVLPSLCIVANRKKLSATNVDGKLVQVQRRRLVDFYGLSSMDSGVSEISSKISDSELRRAMIPHDDVDHVTWLLDRIHILAFENEEMNENGKQINLDAFPKSLQQVIRDFQLRHKKYQLLESCTRGYRLLHVAYDQLQQISMTSDDLELFNNGVQFFLEILQEIKSIKGRIKRGSRRVVQKNLAKWKKEWINMEKNVKSNIEKPGFKAKRAINQIFYKWDDLLRTILVPSIFLPGENPMRASDPVQEIFESVPAEFKENMNLLVVGKTRRDSLSPDRLKKLFFDHENRLINPFTWMKRNWSTGSATGAATGNVQLSNVVSSMNELIQEVEVLLQLQKTQRDMEWRPWPAPTLQTVQDSLLLPTGPFEKLSEAAKAKCIAKNDAFLKQNLKKRDKSTASVHHVEDTKVKPRFGVPLCLFVDLDPKERQVNIKCPSPTYEAIRNACTKSVQAASAFMGSEEEGTDGAALFPIVMFTGGFGQQPKHLRLHLDALVAFLRSQPNQAPGDLALFLVHDELTTKGKTKMKKTLDSCKKHLITDQGLSEEDVQLICDTQIFDVELMNPGLDLDQAVTTMQMVLEHFGATFYFHASDNLRFHEFYPDSGLDFYHSLHTCGRALAFMQKSMYIINNVQMSPEKLNMRVNALQQFKKHYRRKLLRQYKEHDEMKQKFEKVFDDLEESKLDKVARKPDAILLKLNEITQDDVYNIAKCSENGTLGQKLCNKMKEALGTQSCGHLCLAPKHESLRKRLITQNLQENNNEEKQVLQPTCRVTLAKSSSVKLFCKSAIDKIYLLSDDELFGPLLETNSSDTEDDESLPPPTTTSSKKKPSVEQYNRQLLLNGVGHLEIMFFAIEDVRKAKCDIYYYDQLEEVEDNNIIPSPRHKRRKIIN